MLPKIDKYFIKPNNSVEKIKSPKIFPEYDFKLNFDGCSKGNPGLAGAGAVIYNYNTELWASYLFIGEKYTNNHAEYAGLILGLERAIVLGIKTLKVEGDSLLVINQMKGIYKCKSDNLFALYNEAKKLEQKFDKIDYEHVLRNKNKRADELSNKAIDDYLLKVATSL
jgi:ribonuclease HI